MAPLLPSAPAAGTWLVHVWRSLLSIDIFCPQGAQQQTRPPLLLLSIDRTDGRTVGCSTVSSTAVRVLSGPCQQVCVEPPLTSVLNMTLPAAAARAPAAIDRYLLPATELSSPTSLLLSIHWTDNGRTGGRTDTRPLHRRCTAFCANSVKKV